MSKKIVAGNWKMNLDAPAAHRLYERLAGYAEGLSGAPAVEIILAPPYIYLEALVARVAELSHVRVAAQNCHHHPQGAYTGEVSAGMLQSIGVHDVIIGHSERRSYFGESDELLNGKLRQALLHGLRPIFCCGEEERVRDAGSYTEYVQDQLTSTILRLPEEEFQQCVIAYEPVWAIGTGKVATPAQAQEMHASIRGMVRERYGSTIADNTAILYGGSCKPANAGELFACPDVDGGLIGGASLDAGQFIDIIESCT